jgi:hypothetical protein
MAAFSGSVGVHVATLVRTVSKTRKSKASSWIWRSYLPLRSEDDDDDTAPRESATPGPSGTLVEPSSQCLVVARGNRERERMEVTEKPTTARVWIWILLCMFYGDYLESYGELDDNFKCQISLECLRASLA